jgi:hypothetical protein
MNPKTKTILIAVLVLVLTIAGIATAAIVLRNPEAEDPADTPLTPTPTPAPTPTVTPIVQPTEIHLSSNLTVGSFYKGDTLTMTAQLNQPVAGINVTLWNNGLIVKVGNTPVSALTDFEGKVVFNRAPLNPFHYHVKATLP